MPQISFIKPLIGLCAYSGSGKTTLLEKLIPALNNKGIRIAVIKHAHHSFDIDYPAKDSYKIRKAGAQQILISSHKRWAMIEEHESEDHELSLEEALSKLDVKNIDLVIVEGYKAAAFPKIEIHRPKLGKPLISTEDPHVIAIATDEAENLDTDLPLLDLNEINAIADFIDQNISSRAS